jgi:hypothetical protein
MQVIKYKEFLIVARGKTVDLCNPYSDGCRVVKSVRAAKWRISRAQNLAKHVRGLV